MWINETNIVNENGQMIQESKNKIIKEEIKRITNPINWKLKDTLWETEENYNKMIEEIWIEWIEEENLTIKQLKNIKKFKELWIKFGIGTIWKIKDLTNEQINNIKTIKELWFEIEIREINEIKDLELNDEQINNIKELKGFWIKIYKSEINKIKDIKLKNKQINNINTIKKFWIEIKNLEDIDKIKDLELNDEQINNINTIKKELWTIIYWRDTNEIKNQNLNYEQINEIKNLIKDLGINEHWVQSLKALSEINYKKIVKIKNIWINIKNINKSEIKILNETNFDLEKLEKLRNIWININKFNIIKLNETDFDFKKLEKIKNIWININIKNIINLNKTDFNFEKLEKIKGKIESFWININEHNIINLNNIKIENFKWIEEIYNKYWIIVTIDKNEWDKLELTEEEKSNLKNSREILKKEWVIISSINELKIMIDITSNTLQSKKKYIEKKENYLQRNQTLTNEKFNELFKTWKDRWKYWIQNIHQKRLWYCYAYTWFELLKKSNFFDILIKTSLKETNTWWEVKIPLAEPNWHIIKVNNEEIDKKYSYTDIDDWEKKEKSINSDSSLWQKILEIAFIKEYIINPPEYLVNPQDEESNKDKKRFETRKNILKKIKAKEIYEKTGDIEITWELLNVIEGWITNVFIEKIMWGPIDKYETDDTEIIRTIYDYINSWNIKIEMWYGTHDLAPKRINYTWEDGTKHTIISDHAYSIERTFTDMKTREKYIIFVNPHNTSEKHKITLNESIKIFNNVNITTININKLFNNKE